MLKIDEQLLTKTNGKVGSLLEDAIENMNPNKNLSIYGATLPLDSILVNREKAKSIIFSTLLNYWGDVDLFLHAALQTTTIDLESANERLNSYLHSSIGQKSIFDFLLIHNCFQFENLVNLIFGKEIKISRPVGGLHEIYLYQVGTKLFLHITYNDRHDFWNILFTKKVYTVFTQAPLQTIQNPTKLIQKFKSILEIYYSLNRSVVITNELIKYIDNENVRSFQLKELHLFNLISHFNGGKRNYRKINKIIEEIIYSWSKGKWALSEKEFTLLQYILFINASKQNDIKKVIEYGNYLISHDRLINHSIELLVEYSDVLPNLKPEPATLVKLYHKNYLEQVFFIMIDSLILNKQFCEVILLLSKHEIASCVSIYEYFNTQQFDKDQLHRIEATVQKDIAYIVDNSLHHVIQSIDVWLNNYQDEKSPYFEIAIMTSKHICNLLKALFATEQYELFEKLMEIYSKYLKIDSHFTELRDFLSVFVKN